MDRSYDDDALGWMLAIPGAKRFVEACRKGREAELRGSGRSPESKALAAMERAGAMAVLEDWACLCREWSSEYESLPLILPISDRLGWTPMAPVDDWFRMPVDLADLESLLSRPANLASDAIAATRSESSRAILRITWGIPSLAAKLRLLLEHHRLASDLVRTLADVGSVLGTDWAARPRFPNAVLVDRALAAACRTWSRIDLGEEAVPCVGAVRASLGSALPLLQDMFRSAQAARELLHECCQLKDRLMGPSHGLAPFLSERTRVRLEQIGERIAAVTPGTSTALVEARTLRETLRLAEREGRTRATRRDGARGLRRRLVGAGEALIDSTSGVVDEETLDALRTAIAEEGDDPAGSRLQDSLSAVLVSRLDVVSDGLMPLAAAALAHSDAVEEIAAVWVSGDPQEYWKGRSIDSALLRENWPRFVSTKLGDPNLRYEELGRLLQTWLRIGAQLAGDWGDAAPAFEAVIWLAATIEDPDEIGKPPPCGALSGVLGAAVMIARQLSKGQVDEAEKTTVEALDTGASQWLAEWAFMVWRRFWGTTQYYGTRPYLLSWARASAGCARAVPALGRPIELLRVLDELDVESCAAVLDALGTDGADTSEQAHAVLGDRDLDSLARWWDQALPWLQQHVGRSRAAGLLAISFMDRLQHLIQASGEGAAAMGWAAAVFPILERVLVTPQPSSSGLRHAVASLVGVLYGELTRLDWEGAQRAAYLLAECDFNRMAERAPLLLVQACHLRPGLLTIESRNAVLRACSVLEGEAAAAAASLDVAVSALAIGRDPLDLSAIPGLPELLVRLAEHRGDAYLAELLSRRRLSRVPPDCGLWQSVPSAVLRSRRILPHDITALEQACTALSATQDAACAERTCRQLLALGLVVLGRSPASGIPAQLLGVPGAWHACRCALLGESVEDAPPCFSVDRDALTAHVARTVAKWHLGAAEEAGIDVQRVATMAAEGPHGPALAEALAQLSRVLVRVALLRGLVQTDRAAKLDSSEALGCAKLALLARELGALDWPQVQSLLPASTAALVRSGTGNGAGPE